MLIEPVEYSSSKPLPYSQRITKTSYAKGQVKRWTTEGYSQSLTQKKAYDAIYAHVQQELKKPDSSITEVATRFGKRLVRKAGQIIHDPAAAITYYLVSSLPIPLIDETLAEDLARKVNPNFKKIDQMGEGDKIMLKKVALAEYGKVMDSNPGLKTQLIQESINRKPLGSLPLRLPSSKPKISFDSNRLRTLKHLQARMPRNPHAGSAFIASQLASTPYSKLVRKRT